MPLPIMKRTRGRPKKAEELKEIQKKAELSAKEEEPQRRRSTRNVPIPAPSTLTQPVPQRRKLGPQDETASSDALIETNSQVAKKIVRRRIVVLPFPKTKPLLAPTPVENLTPLIEEETKAITANTGRLEDSEMMLKSPTSETQNRQLLLSDEMEVVRGDARKKRIKLMPEERMLLAQLYHDNFLLYNSSRYGKYHYIFPNTNLRQLLTAEWAERLTKLGSFRREASDIEENIKEMVMEVQQYRNLNTLVCLKMAAIHAAPSFRLINKVFDYMRLECLQLEKLLDDYELKQIVTRDESLLAGQVEQWSSEEMSTLVVFYNQSKDIYNNQNPLHQEGYMDRQNLLSSWSSRSQKLRLKTPSEIERQIVYQRNEYYKSLKKENGDETMGEFLCNGWTDRLSSVDLSSISLESVLAVVKEIQENFITQIKDNGIPVKTFNVVELPVAPPPPLQHFETPANSSCRTNRPHMSRRERHLLAMLYRRNHVEYELFNAPHIARKTAVNRKWVMLKEWAGLLTTLGVSQREPEELSTKISQYKNIVKNRKRYVKKGPAAFALKSEYKMRRIRRPLSPITRFFDLTDKSKEPEATEETIQAYLTECHTILRYPFSSTPPISPHKRKKVKLAAIRAKLAIIKPKAEVMVNQGSRQEAAELTPPLPSPEPAPSNPTNGEITVSDYVMNNLIVKKAQPQEESSNIFEMIFNDCKQMEKYGLSTLTYEVIDASGQVIKMAMSREENLRDINFFLWTKCMDVELEQQVAFYVCYMCEIMSCPSSDKIRYRNLPGSGILAQQTLPTMAVAGDVKQVQIRWAKSPPKHRCVPFLMATAVEKLASLAHIIVRTTEMKDEKK